MASVAEKVELTDGECHGILPKREVYLLDSRQIGDNKRQHGAEYQYNTRIDMFFELAQETVVHFSYAL